FFTLTMGRVGWSYTAWRVWGKWLSLSALIAGAVWMNRRGKKPPLLLQCGFLTFLFLFSVSGFGLQYLAWLVPWVAALEGWAGLLVYATSAAFLFNAYTHWSREFPWYLADVYYPGALPGGGLYIFLETTCWFSIWLATI